MVTIHDVAKKANVSPMTVSRALNNPHLIRQETLKRVEQAIAELGYIPNKAAQSLVSKKTQLLSIMITNISNPFFTEIVRGAEDKALQMGYQLILNNSDEDPEKESNYIHSLIARGIDGVLIAPTGDQSRKNLRQLIKCRIPFVLVDRSVPDIACDLIQGDNTQSVRLLVDHLVEQGHTNIALINGPDTISNSRERKKAFQEALKLCDIPENDELILQTPLIGMDMDRVIKKLISLPPERKPTAILAANNFIGVNAIKSLRKLKIGVPQDMAVVCFDDPEPIPDFNPFLTVAAQPAYNLGFLGMQLLIERIEGRTTNPFQTIILPSTLIVRKSSMPTEVQG